MGCLPAGTPWLGARTGGRWVHKQVDARRPGVHRGVIGTILVPCVARPADSVQLHVKKTGFFPAQALQACFGRSAHGFGPAVVGLLRCGRDVFGRGFF